LIDIASPASDNHSGHSTPEERTMFRFIHRGTLLSAVALLGVLVGCRNEKEFDNKNAPAEGNGGNPFDVFSKSRGTTDRMTSQNNLKKIMVAMHNFASANGHFPGMVFDKKDGKPLLSWRVAILPYLEEDNLARRFKMDEPWDSPNNKELLSLMPRVFATPGVIPPGDTETHYRVFVSDHLAASRFAAPFKLLGPPKGPRPVQIVGITDGTSNTVAVVEAAEAAPWTKPEGLELGDAKPLPKFASFWNGGFLVAMFDGSVRSVPGTFDEKEMRKALSHADGEVQNSFP
jgi:hypothetical protein